MSACAQPQTYFLLWIRDFCDYFYVLCYDGGPKNGAATDSEEVARTVDDHGEKLADAGEKAAWAPQVPEAAGVLLALHQTEVVACQEDQVYGITGKKEIR